MGIRVNKVLGYGLTDLNVECLDDRINPKGFLASSCDDQETTFTRRGYSKFLLAAYKALKVSRKKRDNCDEQELNRRDERFDLCIERYWFKPSKEDGKIPVGDWEPYESVLHDPEYGLPNVLLICPPEMVKSWHRRDQTIDYYEESLNYKQLGRFQEIPHGIYPYEGSYMDARTGQRVKEGHELKWAMDNFKEFPEAIKQRARASGFADDAEAARYLAPRIPTSVRYLCKYLKLFKDDATINQLRPLLYVYWS